MSSKSKRKHIRKTFSKAWFSTYPTTEHISRISKPKDSLLCLISYISPKLKGEILLYSCTYMLVNQEQRDRSLNLYIDGGSLYTEKTKTLLYIYIYVCKL